MSLKKAILAVLEVFGECRESELFNLLTVGHEAGLFDAGLIKWGVDCFYSRRMYEELASLVACRAVRRNGHRTFETCESINDQKLVEFYRKIRELNVSPYRVAWYLQAKRLSPSGKLRKLSESEKKKIDEILERLNVVRA